MLRHNQKYLETIYKYFAPDINRSDEKYQETPESKNYFRKVEENRKDTVLFDRLQETLQRSEMPMYWYVILFFF